MHTVALFGGNVLSYRNSLDAQNGYAGAIDDLGVTNLRFPGGSLTEYYFDINIPDSAVGVHSETGQIKPLIPLSDFMSFAAANGHTATIVIPTRHYLSEDRDENGDRYAEIDEDALRTYVRDVASGEFGGAEIAAFEIGNEYWHSADMSAVEYGRVAAEMVKIVDDEISLISDDHPEAASIDIIVQMGQNDGTGDLSDILAGQTSAEIVEEFEQRYDLDLDGDAVYAGGGVNYANIANEMIISEFERAGAIEAVDGIVAHVYSQGSDYENSRTFLLNQIEATWHEDYEGLETYVTEWNLKASTGKLDGEEDFGLYQAAEMLNIVEEFALYDVESANVWPLIQVTDNALSIKGVYGETNAPGAMFQMMAENLPGKELLDLNPNDASRTEAEFDDMKVHGFADRSDLLFFVASEHDSGVLDTNLDIGELVAEFESIEINILGVEDGAEIGSNHSAAFIETIDPSDAMQNGLIDIPLDPGEIAQIIVHDYVLSDAYGDLFGAGGGQGANEDDDATTGFVDPDNDLLEELVASSDGDGGAMDWVLALLPLTGLLGLG